MNGSVALFENGETSGSVLEGFTLTNGSGTYIPWNGNYSGGGICCTEGDPTISNNIITGNVITGYGGGMLKTLAQNSLHVPLDDMGMVESIHLLLFHWILNDVYARINRVGRYAKPSGENRREDREAA